jgi:hypothetical protein
MFEDYMTFSKCLWPFGLLAACWRPAGGGWWLLAACWRLVGAGWRPLAASLPAGGLLAVVCLNYDYMCSVI